MSIQRYLTCSVLVAMAGISTGLGTAPSFANEQTNRSSQLIQTTTSTSIYSNSSLRGNQLADGVEDDQSMVQFQIQMGTSDLQNAENVRSQAEKRLEQQREDLIRNWGG